MTSDAILKASDEQIRNDLGLSKLGDRLSLRSFCENRGKRGSRQKQLVQEPGRKRQRKQNSAQLAHKRKNTTAGTGNTKSTRKVEIAWLHCTKGSKTSKLVRMNDGGGTRLVDISKSAKKEEIIESAKGLFFPNGKSSLGLLRKMDVDLLNFKKEKVSTILVDNKHVPFTLGLYIEAFKLSKVRLYLSTKQNERVEMAWLHCTKGSKASKLVWMNEGLGTRLLDVLKSAKKEEIIESAKGLFFPNGESSLGLLREIDVDLLNFKKEEVSTILVGGEHVPFTRGIVH